MEDEIAAWLRRQAEADLAAARIISDGGFEPERWDTDPPGQVNPAAEPGSAGVSSAIGQDPEYSCGWVPVRAWDHVIGQPPDERPAPGAVPVLAELGRREFDHVIRHDPRTEAARAESVLAVLGEYETTWKLAESAWEQEAGEHALYDRARAFKRVVRLLAFGYRHREGWQEAWRP